MFRMNPAGKCKFTVLGAKNDCSTEQWKIGLDRKVNTTHTHKKLKPFLS